MSRALAGVLLMLPLVAFVAAVGAILVATRMIIYGMVDSVRTQRAGESGAPAAARMLAGLAVLAGAVAVISYVVGMSAGFYLLDPHQLCGVTLRDYQDIEHQVLPVRRTCRFVGGSRELVPAWVNPTFFTSLGVLVTSVTAGVVVRRRSSRQ